MIDTKLFLKKLKKTGYTFFAGVPCSILKNLLKEIENDPEISYIPAVRENAALGVASGAYLTGKKPCVLMQNSGLGNIVNAITSFNHIYKIPSLVIMTWRGFEGKDAPEHIIMGKIMTELLDELKMPYKVIGENFDMDIEWADGIISKTSLPAVLILKDGLLK